MTPTLPKSILIDLSRYLDGIVSEGKKSPDSADPEAMLLAYATKNAKILAQVGNARDSLNAFLMRYDA